MSDYIEFLQEVFDQFGPITARKMFGGYGIYHQGLMFALVADDTLFLKADAETIPLFEVEGSGPFEYEKNGKVTKMSYYLAPEEIMDDREFAAIWGQRAFQAALRAKAGSKPVRRKKKL
ncbi:TfoX/Sxy family protein [Nitrincola sp. MINF-07-Sa-05]|uniref:TfoX/Sxy family protein n=1 Tax=Nitrincola salilacus TaxID=3400273 RepID=UPI003917C697